MSPSTHSAKDKKTKRRRKRSDRERAGQKKPRRRRKKKEEEEGERWAERRRRRAEKKTQKSNPAEMYFPAETQRNTLKQPKHTETPRNFIRGGIGGCLVPVCIPVRDFPSVSAGTERNIQHWFQLGLEVEKRWRWQRVGSNGDDGVEEEAAAWRRGWWLGG